MKADEILTGFRLPTPPAHSGAHYIQLGKRKSAEINVVNVASFLEFDPKTKIILNARIALGSVAAMPTIPAILNAVYDAAGVRLYELPLTPERVYTAIQEYKEKNYIK